MFTESVQLMFAAGIALVCVPSHASTVLTVLNIGALNGLGTFYLEIQLTHGSSAGGDGNSSAVIDHFGLTGGLLGPVLPPVIGNVSGDLTGGLTFVDGPLDGGPVEGVLRAPH